MAKKTQGKAGCSIIVPMRLEQEIKDKGRELGFDAVGITDASPIGPTDVARLRTWLESGHAGKMRYMHRNVEKRIDPAKLLSGAQSVVVVALNYKPLERRKEAPPPASPRSAPPGAATRSPTPLGRVAQYARYEDYHHFMKPLLLALAEFLRARADGPCRFKACVDSAPLAERALAVRAGLGFIGTNHMLIHPTLGPQIFLGELITTVPLDPDAPGTGSCSDCRRCIEACPTGALRADGRLDARRCISYLTIEHAGEIPDEWADKIGDRIFGCDECVLACPHQAAAPARRNRELKGYPEHSELNLHDVLALTAASFGDRFGGSPISRVGLEGLRRNARICLRHERAHPSQNWPTAL